MAAMDHDSYWYHYFAARRDVELYLGLGSIAFAFRPHLNGHRKDIG